MTKKDKPTNAPVFELSGVTGTITSINLDDESKGKDAKRRVDLDMVSVVDPSVLTQMAVIAEEAPNYQQMFFTEDGKEKAIGVKDQTFDREFLRHVFTVHLPSGEKVFTSKVVKKFKAVPAPNSKVNLSFQIQIYPDNANELWALSGWKGAPLDISIERPAQKDVEE